MANDLAMFFLEEGKVLSLTEYKNRNPVPYPVGLLSNIFGSYPRAVNYAKFTNKEGFKELEKGPKKADTKKVEPKKDELKKDEPKKDELTKIAEQGKGASSAPKGK